MKLSTLTSLLTGGRLRLLFDLQRLLRPTYRLAFLSAAATEGLLARLRGGPIPAQQLLAELAPDPAVREGLAAWLAVGVRLGELSLDERGYGVQGRLARRLAEPDHDAMAALIEEAASLHYRMLRELPARAREARPMTLADQDGLLIARSSRVFEPILGEAVDDVVSAGGPMRLLEIGCGSGVYIRRARRGTRSLPHWGWNSSLRWRKRPERTSAPGVSSPAPPSRPATCGAASPSPSSTSRRCTTTSTTFLSPNAFRSSAMCPASSAPAGGCLSPPAARAGAR